MKILHVVAVSLPTVAGYTIRTKYIVINQKMKGHEPIVVTSPYQPMTENAIRSGSEFIDGIKHYRTNYLTSFKKTDRKLIRFAKMFVNTQKYPRALIEICKKEKPDIIHAHSDHLNGISAAKAGKALGIPVLYEVRGLWADAAVANDGLSESSWKYKYGYLMNKRAFNAVDHICCLGDVLKQELLKLDIKPEKISVTHNAVDFKSFSPIPKDKHLFEKFNLQGLVLGFIGSIRKNEGLDILIDAMPTLLKTHPDIKAMIIGGGSEVEINRLKALAESKSVSDKVIFTGRVPHEQIEQYYSLIDVMVYPRINMKLNQKVTPLKPLETMVMEKVILASDVGGLAELINDGQTGILFTTENLEDFIRCSIQLIEDEALRKRLTENAKDWVKKNRDWEKAIEVYNPMYAKLKLM